MKIDNYELDEQQEAIVLDESNYLLLAEAHKNVKFLLFCPKMALVFA